MPYNIEHHGSGFFVIRKSTGEKKNKHPMTKEQAQKYMAALYANEPKDKK